MHHKKKSCLLYCIIRDDLVIKPKAKIYFVEKDSNYLLSGDGFLSKAENCPLSNPVINYDQQAIKVGRYWEDQ